jgi:hypothetical protein
MRNQLISKNIIRLFLNGFIIFHLAAFACWASPVNLKFRDEFVQWIRPYMHWSGLWQSWDMFAPNPVNINAHLEAKITFQDGTQSTWKFPRMDQMGYFERYLKERYRKWSSDRVRLDSYSATWKNTAQYIARIYDGSSGPPKKIQLIRYWAEIPPPQPNSIVQPHPKVPPHNNSYTFFTYFPSKEDFS